MNVAIILAGGIGSRLGADRPKQFIEVLGKPILAYTIEKFENHPEIDAIEVVCITAWKKNLNEILERYHYKKIRWVTDGGETFQESVMKGIMCLKNTISDDDIVMTHFGASPFIEADLISDCIRVCKAHNNAISTTPFLLLSGIKDAGGQSSSTYINRDSIACMNSPHGFQYGFIKMLYEKAVETGVINEVEPHTSTLMQHMGYPLFFSKGSQGNIKITTKEDLDLFEGYVLMKNMHANDGSGRRD